MIPFILIVITSSIAVIAGYVDYQSKLKDQKEQTEKERKRSEEAEKLLKKSNDILSKTTDIIASQHAVIDTSNKIIELQNELATKNDKIQELQGSTLDKLTGGKSVPKFIFILINNTLRIRIFNETTLPIRNVAIQILYINFLTDKKNGENDLAESDDKHVAFGDISVKSHIDNAYVQEFQPGVQKFHITYTVSWLNGFYLGGFEIENNKVVGNSISEYKAGFNIDNSVQVNGEKATLTNAKAIE